MILSCVNINKSFGAVDVLKDINFLIEDKEKAAIVGVNGAGKTTLFKIITGEVSKDSGEVIYSKGAKSVGYLSQNLELDEELSISEALILVFSDVMELEEEIRNLEKEMSKLKGKELEEVMDKYTKLTQKFEQGIGYEYKSRVRGVTKGLGFSDEEAEKKIKFLSGGEKTRVSLGRLLLSNPDLLLLDEPTNHLDISSIEWLEDYLKNYDGAILLISHDRYFINRIVTKVIEIENTKSTVYNGNYNQYSKEKEVQRQIQLKQFLEQQKEIKRQEEVIKQLRSFNREKSVKRAESREKALAKIERVEKPEELPETMRFIISPKRVSGNDVLDVIELEKSFGERKLFKDASFLIKKGDKAALVGPNGVGKTTLIKIILGLIESDNGKVKEGSNVSIGYYDQGQQNLNLEKTILDELIDEYPQLTVLEIRNALAAFVFTGDDVYKKIHSLSGGEKGRVALAKIMLSKANFLILDEPTNHLDIFSKEILEDTIRNYEGTVLYISHDRYFINNTATKILELSQNGVTTFYGDYDYYLDKRQEEKSIQVLETESEEKKEYLDKKKNQADERKRKAQLRKVEDEIETLENKCIEYDKLLESKEVATNHLKAEEIFKEKVIMQEKLEELYETWETLSE